MPCSGHASAAPKHDPLPLSTHLPSSTQRPHTRDRAAADSAFAADGRPATGSGGRLSLPAALAAGLAALGFAAILYAWLSGGGSIDLPWAPTLGLRLHFRLDALGALYSLLATGIGAAVLLYSGH